MNADQMPPQDWAQLRLRTLELARDILHNQYVDVKAQRHNDWSAQAEIAWKTQGVRIPYPPFPDYFTSVDVVTQAQCLWQFVLADHVCEHVSHNNVNPPQAFTPTNEPPTSVTPTHDVITDKSESQHTDASHAPDNNQEDVTSVPPMMSPAPEHPVPVSARPLQVLSRWRNRSSATS